MPASLPQSVRSVLGEEAARDFSRWLDEKVREQAVPRDEYREVLSRLNVVETHLGEMDKRLDRVEQRLNSIDQRFEQMSARFDQRFDQINARFDDMAGRMETMMRWTVGTLALFGTIVTLLIAIAEFAS